MDKMLLINLYGRLTQLKMALDKLRNFGDEKAFKYYAEPFLKLKKEDIERAFEDFTKPLTDYIWEKYIKQEQERIKESSYSVLKAFGLDLEFSNFYIMVARMVEKL